MFANAWQKSFSSLLVIFIILIKYTLKNPDLQSSMNALGSCETTSSTYRAYSFIRELVSLPLNRPMSTPLISSTRSPTRKPASKAIEFFVTRTKCFLGLSLSLSQSIDMYKMSLLGRRQRM